MAVNWLLLIDDPAIPGTKLIGVKTLTVNGIDVTELVLMSLASAVNVLGPSGYVSGICIVWLTQLMVCPD
jgi:hypothetical protein